MSKESKSIEKAQASSLVQFGSFDLEEMQEEAAKLPSGGGNYFTPRQGTNVVRFLPPKPGKKAFVTYYKHWFQSGRERKTIICTKYQYNEPCSICRQGDKLRSTGNRLDVQKASAFQPQSSVYVNVVDMKDPEKGVQLWRMAPGVWKGITAATELAQVKNFAHPETGYNILFKRKGEGLKTEYSGYTLARESTKLEGWQELLEGAPDLSSIEAAPSDEEVDEALEGEFEERKGKGGGGKKGRKDDADDDEEDADIAY